MDRAGPGFPGLDPPKAALPTGLRRCTFVPAMTDKPESEQDPVSPEVRKKAERTIWILYGVMALFILLPFLILFFR